MINYQLEMERTIARLQAENRRPTLLLHSCCAPCSSAVLERLLPAFDVTIFYYNPNISPEEEFLRRVQEQRRLISLLPHEGTIGMIETDYDGQAFERIAKGLEDAPEGGERCKRCFELRLGATAKRASQDGYDYFATTLTVSPLKNAQRINDIGMKLAERAGIRYLASDFKKKDGYRRSCELSRQYGLYRQDYCGCIYSRMERDRRKAEKSEK